MVFQRQKTYWMILRVLCKTLSYNPLLFPLTFHTLWQLCKEIHAPLFSARNNGTAKPCHFLYVTASGTQAQTQTSKQCVGKL